VKNAFFKDKRENGIKKIKLNRKESIPNYLNFIQ